MNIVTKDFPVTVSDATDDSPYGAFEVILSAPTLDRDGEIIDAKAFEPLPDHITFDTDHSMTCDSVVGSGQPYYAEDGTLRVKGGFAADERSQTIRQKVTDGHIRTTSVTFMAAERLKDEKGIPHIKRAELLNGTFTPIPSNRESVVLTAKSILVKEGRRNSTADMEAIQTSHDLMVGLGASCEAKSARRATSGKSIVGSIEALRDRVWDAVEDTYERACCIRGVIPNGDGGGVVIFDAWDANYDLESYQQTYTDDGAVVTLTGEATVVDVMEIVTPDADADREADDELKSAENAADEAAAVEAAAKSAADSADETAAELIARQTLTANQARAQLGL